MVLKKFINHDKGKYTKIIDYSYRYIALWLFVFLTYTHTLWHFILFARIRLLHTLTLPTVFSEESISMAWLILSSQDLGSAANWSSPPWTPPKICSSIRKIFKIMEIALMANSYTLPLIYCCNYMREFSISWRDVDNGIEGIILIDSVPYDELFSNMYT